MKTKLATELEFISRIKRDGSGIEMCTDEEINRLQDERNGTVEYDLICLSATQKTYIAHGFNSYVVRIKQN